jgi:hypothetical protein
MGIVTNVTDKYQKCIDACTVCAQACEECFMLCLNEPDVAARKNCISGLVECASICRLAACFMSMDAKHAKELCTVCATICDSCGKECNMFKDDHCTKCAEICKSCAAECRNMAQ